MSDPKHALRDAPHKNVERITLSRYTSSRLAVFAAVGAVVFVSSVVAAAVVSDFEIRMVAAMVSVLTVFTAIVVRWEHARSFLEIDHENGTLRGRGKTVAMADVRGFDMDTDLETSVLSVVAETKVRNVHLALVPNEASAKRLLKQLREAHEGYLAKNPHVAELAKRDDEDRLVVRVERRAEEGGPYRAAAPKEERIVEVAFERYSADRMLASMWTLVIVLVAGLVLLGVGGAELRLAGGFIALVAAVSLPLVRKMKRERIGFVAKLDAGVVSFGSIDEGGRVAERGATTLPLAELTGATTDSIEDSENEWVIAELRGGSAQRLFSADRPQAEHFASRLRSLVELAAKSREEGEG